MANAANWITVLAASIAARMMIDQQCYEWRVLLEEDVNDYMNIEEYLTHYDLMRGDRDKKIKDLQEASEATRNKENIIRALEEEINQMRYKDED